MTCSLIKPSDDSDPDD